MERDVAQAILIAGICLGLAAVLPGYILLRQRRRFMRIAQRARGVVVAVRSDTSAENARYALTLRFAGTDGVTRTAEILAHSSCDVGTEFPILYNPAAESARLLTTTAEVLVDTPWVVWSLPILLLSVGIAGMAGSIVVWLSFG